MGFYVPPYLDASGHGRAQKYLRIFVAPPRATLRVGVEPTRQLIPRRVCDFGGHPYSLSTTRLL